MMAKRTVYTLTATVLKLVACSSSTNADTPIAGERPSKLIQANWEMPLEANTASENFKVTTAVKIEEKLAVVIATCSTEGSNVTVATSSEIVLTDSDFTILADKQDTQKLKVGDKEYPCTASIHKGFYRYRLDGDDKVVLTIDGKEKNAAKLK